MQFRPKRPPSWIWPEEQWCDLCRAASKIASTELFTLAADRAYRWTADHGNMCRFTQDKVRKKGKQKIMLLSAMPLVVLVISRQQYTSSLTEKCSKLYDSRSITSMLSDVLCSVSGSTVRSRPRRSGRQREELNAIDFSFGNLHCRAPEHVAMSRPERRNQKLGQRNQHLYHKKPAVLLNAHLRAQRRLHFSSAADSCTWDLCPSCV